MFREGRFRILSVVLYPFLAGAMVFSTAAYAKVFEVSTAAEFQAALNEAAVNGEDDTIRLAAGVYSTADNGVEFLAVTDPAPTPQSPSTVKIYGDASGEETIPSHIAFSYMPRFDDDVAGHSSCPMSGGQLCLEPYALTIEGAGMDSTILDGGGQSIVLTVNLTLFRSQESGKESGNYGRTYSAGPGKIYAPIFSESAYQGILPEIEQQPIIATIPEPADDSGVTITVKNLTIQNGYLPPRINSQSGEEVEYTAFLQTVWGCSFLVGYDLEQDGLVTEGIWQEDSCYSAGMAMHAKDASLVVDAVKFRNNVANNSRDASGAGLGFSGFGGDATVRNGVFLGNLAGNSRSSTGGGAHLLTFYGDILVENTQFGDGTLAGQNLSDGQGGGLFAQVGPALAWDDPEDAAHMPVSALFDPLNAARLAQTNDSEPFPPELAVGNKVVVRNSQFLGNRAVDGGGAFLFSHYGHQGVEVTDSVFQGNSVGIEWDEPIGSGTRPRRDSGRAGGLFVEAMSGDVLIERVSFDQNTVQAPSNSYPDGVSALMVNSEHAVVVRESTFTNNQSLCDWDYPEGSNYARYCDIDNIGPFELRGVVTFTENIVMDNTAGAAGGGLILSGGAPPGTTVRVTRNRIQGNESRGSNGGIEILAPYQNILVASNYIADNTSANSRPDYASGIVIRTLSGAIDMVHNTIRNNQSTYTEPESLSTPVREYPAGGAYVQAEFSEIEVFERDDNHPNYDASDTSGYPDFTLASAGSINIANNNFWQNTIVEISPPLSPAGTSETSALVASDLRIDNLTADDASSVEPGFQNDAVGAQTTVNTNNFTESESFALICPTDDANFDCDAIIASNISVDPGFQNENDGLILPGSPLLGAQGPGNNEVTVDFYGLDLRAIGAFWIATLDSVPVPTLGGLGLLLLGLLMLIFGRRRARDAERV